MSAPAIVVKNYFEALQRLDAGAAVASIADDATVKLVHSKANEALLSAYTRQLIDSNPGVVVRVRNLFGSASGRVVAEVTLDGITALPFLVPNNHGGAFYLDQAWVFNLRAGLIQDATLYWCRYQINRRLTVQRPDVVAEMA